MKKFLAVLISLCLLETSALGSADTSLRANNVKAEAAVSDSLLNYGSVTLFENKNSSDMLVIIQDLHCHPGVQKNISSAVEYLYTKYKVENVFVEGAAGDIDLSWLTSINDKLFADKAAESLIGRGKLTGAEYFAYKNNAAGILKGIEEKDVHLENLRRLAAIVDLKPEISAALEDMKKDLDSVQNSGYSAANKKIARLYGKYKAGKIDSAKYYRRLVNISKEIQNGKNPGIFAADFFGIKEFPEIEKYIGFEKSRKSLNVKKAQAQLLSVISALKNKLPYGEYAEFVRNTDSFQDINAVCAYIGKFEAQGLADLSGLKDLRQILNNSFAYKDINPVSLVRAEKRFLKQLQLAASESEKEALITILSELFDNFSDYYNAKLDSEGYTYLKSFGLENYKKYWKETISEKHIDYFEKHAALFGKYYDTNLDRDGIFVKFIEHSFSGGGQNPSGLNSGSYENILSRSEKLNVVVCGGFHTYGLINEVKKKDISYIVITPQIEGEVKLSDTIYEDILMSSHSASAYAIALQVLSQTGRANQFSEIISSVIHDEIASNPGADLTVLVNAVVDEVCNTSVPDTELEKSSLRVYDKPVNKGVKVDENGKVTVNIYFESSKKEEEIRFSLYDESASFFGSRFKKTAPFWEWVYMLPFSSILLDSRQTKKVMMSFFSLQDRNKVRAIKYTNALKFLDIVSSAFFIAGLAVPFFSGGAFVAAVLGFFAVRALIFAAGHNNTLNLQGEKARLLRLGAGTLFSVPAALLILFSAAPLTVVFWGIGINIIFHMLFNMIVPALAAKKEKNLFFTGKDFIRSFMNFREESYRMGKVSPETLADFLIHASSFSRNEDAGLANMVMPIFLDIAEMYVEREKGGHILNSIAKSLSSQLGYVDENINRELIAQNNRLYNYLVVLHYRNDPQKLREFIYGKYNLAPQLRLYALLQLKILGEKIDRNAQEDLIREARSLISHFQWERDITENSGWLYNAELQAYVTAVYLVMTKDYPLLAGEQDIEIFRKISNARFDAQYNNANSGLAFGKEFFQKRTNRDTFPEIIAHELAHICLNTQGFRSRRFLFLRKNLQIAAVHELYADAAGCLLSVVTGRPSHFLQATLNKGFRAVKETTFKEAHAAARTQFFFFMEALEKNHIPFSEELFSETLWKAVDGRMNAKGKDKKKLYFRDLFFEVYAAYVGEYGYTALRPKSLQSNMYLFPGSLAARTYFKASVLGEEYSKLAPFWESVFSLPFSSFITESGAFKQILAAGTDNKVKKRIFFGDIDDAIKYSVPSKIIDAVSSAFLGISFFIPALAVPAVIIFMLGRAFVFMQAHNNQFNSLNEKAGILFGASLLMTLPLGIGLIFTTAAPLMLFAAIPLGFALNILIHKLINNYIDDAAARVKAAGISDAELVDYFKKFEKEAENIKVDSHYKDHPELMRYRAMLKVFKHNKNPETAFQIIGSVKNIARTLSYNGNTGRSVNFANDILAKKIGNILQTGRNSDEALKIYEILNVTSDEISPSVPSSHYYLLLRSFRDDKNTLNMIVSNSLTDIKLRLYAYLLLKADGENVSPDIEESLRKSASELLKNLNTDAFMEDIDTERWFHNEDLKAYMTAVSLILSRYGYFENNAVYKVIDERARLESEYGNADSSFSFGREYISNKKDDFIFGIAHELGHGYLDILGFDIKQKDADIIHKAAIHEFFADVTAIILNLELGRDHYEYVKSVSPYEKEGEEFYYETIDEPHAAARTQLLDLLDIMSKSAHEMDWGHFSQTLKYEILRVKDAPEHDFAEVIYAAIGKYCADKNIPGTEEKPRLKKGFIVPKSDLANTFNFGSVMGDGYADTAPFWEWVYMLPGVSFFAESKIFSKLLSKSFLSGLSEKRIQNTLKAKRYAKIIDIAGIAVAAVSVISGFGLAGMAAYLLSRAIIFSQAHKGLDWKAHWKDKIMMSVVLFGVPGIFSAAAVLAGFTAFSVVPFIVIGIPFNMFFHVFYNKVLVPAFSLKNASVADSDGTAGIKPEEKWKAGAEFIKPFLLKELHAGEDEIEIDIDNETLMPLKYMDGNLFYRTSKVKTSSDGKMHVSLSKSFLEGLYAISDRQKEEYISVFAAQLGLIYEIENSLKYLSAQEKESFVNNYIDSIDDDLFPFARTAYLAFCMNASVTRPSMEEIGRIASGMLLSEYSFSDINVDMLKFIVRISSNINKLKPEVREIVWFQCLEFLGYILQSETWLSPAYYKNQYGFMQYDNEIMPMKYEREHASTSDFDSLFAMLFANHEDSQMMKTKEAALFEYMSNRSTASASLIIPDSISSKFKHMDIEVLEDKVYPVFDIGSPEGIKSALTQRSSRNIFDRYFIIDCSVTENLEKVLKQIDEYNAGATRKMRIKEVMLYNAELEDYALSDKTLSFETAYIFDFSKLTGHLEGSKQILTLFTNVPAVFISNNEEPFTLDYGSRLDNFTIHYLYLLMERGAIRNRNDEDFANRTRISVMPQKKTVEDYAGYYRELIAEIDKLDFFDAAKKVFYEIVKNAANNKYRLLNDFIDGKRVSAEELNTAIDDYRALLNFMFYFQWSDKKDMNYIVSQEEKDLLAEKFTEIMKAPVNSEGVAARQDTMLVTSGMSAIKTIAAFLLSEDIFYISVGRDNYYENMDMFTRMKFGIKKFLESDTENIADMKGDAIFIDLISNSVQKSFTGTKDIPVADIKGIVEDISKRGLKKPFYLCIDNSMYPSFQFADILDGIDLPDNLYIIVYGSMQKMHQRGLEIVTSGFLTLISNGHNQEEILNKLKDASYFTSSSIDNFRYTVLREFLERNNIMPAYAQALNNNAKDIAEALNEISKMLGGAFDVLHSSLYAGEERRVWEKNGRPEIPVVFLRDSHTGEEINSYLLYLFDKFNQEGFHDYVVRDSYGFQSLSNINYGSHITRFNAGINISEDKEKIVRAFTDATFEYFMQSKLLYERVDSIYSYVVTHGINPEYADLIYVHFTNGERINLLKGEQLLKVILILEAAGFGIPEALREKALAFIETIDIETVNDEHRGVYIETYKYFADDLSRSDIIKQYLEKWTSENPVDMAAAAKSLTHMLSMEPAVNREFIAENSSDKPNYTQALADILSAA